ncbi:MAG: hypothetical protein WB775_13220 [Burkholderiaceae bacterium]
MLLFGNSPDTTVRGALKPAMQGEAPAEFQKSRYIWRSNQASQTAGQFTSSHKSTRATIDEILVKI